MSFQNDFFDEEAAATAAARMLARSMPRMTIADSDVERNMTRLAALAVVQERLGAATTTVSEFPVVTWANLHEAQLTAHVPVGGVLFVVSLECNPFTVYATSRPIAIARYRKEPSGLRLERFVSGDVCGDVLICDVPEHERGQTQTWHRPPNVSEAFGLNDCAPGNRTPVIGYQPDNPLLLDAITAGRISGVLPTLINDAGDLRQVVIGGLDAIVVGIRHQGDLMWAYALTLAGGVVGTLDGDILNSRTLHRAIQRLDDHQPTWATLVAAESAEVYEKIVIGCHSSGSIPRATVCTLGCNGTTASNGPRPSPPFETDLTA